MKPGTGKILLFFFVALAALIVTEKTCIVTRPREDSDAMRTAAHLSGWWFSLITKEKAKLGIADEHASHSHYSGMIGEEYSEFTTTLGSLEAKTTAANPEFAALMVRMLHDAGVKEGTTVGVTLSGSFPALSVSTLAALQTIGAKAVIVSSLGSSSYGANQPQATWIDIERWLNKLGGLEYRSALVTYGAEGDTGGGISDEGKAELQLAAKRNGVEIYVPADFQESLERRTAMFSQARIALLINIGGNQVNMGSCAHSTTLPNGYHKTVQSCMEDERGVIVRMNEAGVPFIHLLNIRDLALKHHLPLVPGGNETEAIYTTEKVQALPAVGMLILLLAGIVFIGKK